MITSPIKFGEVWLFRKNQLAIYQLQGVEYLLQPRSRYFSEISLQYVIARCLQVAYERNTSAAIRAPQTRVRQGLKKKRKRGDRRPLYEVVLVHNLRSLISMTTLCIPAHWA